MVIQQPPVHVLPTNQQSVLLSQAAFAKQGNLDDENNVDNHSSDDDDEEGNEAFQSYQTDVAVKKL